MFGRLKQHSQTEAALAAEPMKDATEATSEDAPAWVLVRLNSRQGRVFVGPPPGKDARSQQELAWDPASFNETSSTGTNPYTRTRTPSNHEKIAGVSVARSKTTRILT